LKLPLFGKDWRKRWMHSGRRGPLLHRVYATDWNAWTCEGTGVTACGLMDSLHMPGIFSRMGAVRCPACCRAAGVPSGHGNPFNEGIDV
jgi:hypothetical protein